MTHETSEPFQDALNILSDSGWTIKLQSRSTSRFPLVVLRSKSGKRGLLDLFLKCKPGEEAEYFKGHATVPVLSAGQTAYMASVTGVGKNPLRNVVLLIGINGVQVRGASLAQWLMDVDAHHPRIHPHPQVHVRVGDQSAEVDELVAPFIERIWKAGITTWTSCQYADSGAFPMYINDGRGLGREMAKVLGLKRGEYRIKNGVLWLPLPVRD